MNKINIIYDNVIFSLQKSGGISVVWLELIKRILKNDEFCTKFIEYGTSNNYFRTLLSINSGMIISKNSRFIQLKRFLPIRSKCAERFLFHSTSYRYCTSKKCVNIITVHDFTIENYMTGFKYWFKSWQKKRAISKSDYILCISYNTKNDLLKYLPNIDEKKIHVIYNGVSTDYHITTEIGDKFKIENRHKYVLFIGSRAWYKNFEISAQAAVLFGIEFWIVGSPLSNKEIEFLNKLSRDGGYYTYLGNVTNDELNILYNNAYALLYPSTYEGFGIPVIEAQKAGCPVIAFNSSSIPEIIGDNRLLINKSDPSEIVKKMELLKNSSFRDEVISLGINNSNQFSWDITYKRIMDIYNDAWNKFNNK